MERRIGGKKVPDEESLSSFPVGPLQILEGFCEKKPEDILISEPISATSKTQVKVETISDVSSVSMITY
ncbi:hypothetical protein BTVI_63197 [Pitangus sulphuratus]|nr:hypothetical protein BTVI_63197 [Pitangus sulphuratus]